VSGAIAVSGPIDRVAPTIRPDAAVVQRPAWHDLSFLHWRVPAAQLRALVPTTLEIDTFDDEAYVGLVPFTMTKVRPRWAPPIPGLTSFHETNVRTYVHHRGADPGVWFFSLDAASRLAVLAARTLFHLPYHPARMTLEWREREVSYASERVRPPPLPATCRVTCRPVGAPAAARLGSREHFLAERYLLYTQDRRGRLLRGQVHHAPYPLQPAEVIACDESLLAAAGIVRPAEPPIAHYASGVEVEIFALELAD
jgi:uncharacterized protein YqjF (DUF2071 family)